MTDDLCPHHSVIAADPERLSRGYYASGREREDLIFAVQQLRAQVAALQAIVTAYREAAAVVAEQGA